MKEVKIAERIVVDEPENVERAIFDLVGKHVDFELIQKFIINEQNTIFYLDKKLNTSTKPGSYQDYVWLDTGFRDHADHPIMICLHNSYEGYVGHYTGTVRELANRVKSFDKKNMKDIEKNYSRFLTKYKSRSEERSVSYIQDEMNYAVKAANKELQENEYTEATAFAKAFQKLNIEFEEEFVEELTETEPVEEPEEMSEVQKEITLDLMFDQMEKMQAYIDELLEHIENNEKESKEVIESLQAQNKEYKRALVQMRTYAMQEEKEEKQEDGGKGHNLLAKNEKILVLGNTDIRVAEMKAIARDWFGFEKTDFEFITDYEKIKNAGSRIHNSERFAAVIFGNCPHKVAGMGNYSSIIDEFKQREDCPISIDARNEAGELKVTKQSFRNALARLCMELRDKNVA